MRARKAKALQEQIARLKIKLHGLLAKQARMNGSEILSASKARGIARPDPIMALKQLEDALALGVKHPEIWTLFPTGRKRAIQARVNCLRAYFAGTVSRRVCRCAQSPEWVETVVRRIHEICEKSSA